MPVRTLASDAEVTVVVDGDLGAPATLIQLHSTLSSLAFTSNVPVVVDLSHTTGASAASHRLLDRIARVMSHRRLALRIDVSGSDHNVAAATS